MSNWPGKYIIGLTGNIATGKSVVRRMLEHLGAYTIDADALSHRVMAKGAPGYQLVLDKFGKWLVGKDGEIERKKLGNLVFNDAEALEQLESIVHPLVNQAVSMLIQRATQPIIVVEAIKLLESEMRGACDSIWVTTAPEEVQVERLVRKRGLTKEQALERIRMQNAQSEKIASANVVIRNTGSYDELWEQVSKEWKKISPTGGETLPSRKIQSGEFAVQRGRPRDAAVIAELITRLSKGQRRMKADEVMAEFGDKAYLLLKLKENIVGMVSWQVENLVARTADLYLEDGIDPARALDALIKEVESAAGDLQAEASLLFPPPTLAAQEAVFKSLGYAPRTPDTLGVQAWQDAATESMPEGSMMFFKQLRQDRILRPI